MHHCFLFIVTYLLSLGGKSTQQTSSGKSDVVFVIFFSLLYMLLFLFVIYVIVFVRI